MKKHSVLARNRGFTLTEILIVIAIIGILAAIAYPSYKRSVIKTNRGNVKAELRQLAQRIEAQKLAYKRYDNMPVELFGFSASSGLKNFPSNNPLYTLSIARQNTSSNLANDWFITASPINTEQMKDDGSLVINSFGKTCWKKGTICNPVTDPDWD